MTATSSNRSGDLDAARGAAMVLVCLSHFASGYFPSLDVPGPQQWVSIITLVASPTFVLLSGVLLGWRYRTAPQRFPRFRTHLLDRALFLLTIGHLAIEASQLRRLAAPGEEPIYVVLTDVIAIALIVGPVLVARFGIRGRLVLAALLYTAAWGAVLFWTPELAPARVAKAGLVGLRASEGSIGGYAVPLLPWLAVYIGATCVGHVLAGRTTAGGLLDCPTLWRVGLAGVTIAILGRLVVLDVFGDSAKAGELVTMLSVTWQKVPPGPTYLLFNGGAGLIMIGCLARVRQLAMGISTTRWLELLGRNSAIVFIVQFYVYSVLMPIVRQWTQPAWPLFFGATLLLLLLFAWSWERRGLGRLLTVQPLLRMLPTRPLRTTCAAGLAAIVLLASAQADVLMRPRWGALHASLTRRGTMHAHVTPVPPAGAAAPRSVTSVVGAHADASRRHL